MAPVGFETTISAGERPQTYALDSTDTFNPPLPLQFYYKDYFVPGDPTRKKRKYYMFDM